MKKLTLGTLVLLFTLATQAHPFHRMIVFGDSLIDGGTYKAVAGPKGGGKFTINQGQTWVEALATELQLDVTANREEGFNLPVRVLGGTNYAQGGARVSQNPGLGVEKGYTARAMAEQVQLFKADHISFHKDDLVVVAGGANDILLQVTLLSAKKITLEQAITNVDQVTTDLARLVKAIKASGNPYILVSTLPDMAATPSAKESGAVAVQLFQKFVNQFNQGVLKKIKGLLPLPIVHGLKITILRTDLLDKKVTANPARYGVTNVTTPACATDLLPAGSALFCSERTLVAADAMTYKFADKIHPTPFVHKLIADEAMKSLPTSNLELE